MPTELPPPARRYLQTPEGRRGRAIVHAFHHWLDQRRLSLAELTPDHFEQFLARFRNPAVAKRTNVGYRQLARRYVQWLYEHARVDFDPEQLRRPHPLPPIAGEFLASLAPTLRPGTCVNYTVALRRFHRWLDVHGLNPQRLTRRDLAPWFQELHAKGLHPATSYRILRDVRTYLRWLSEHQRMRTAPDELVRRSDFPKLPQYLPRPLTVEADRELKRRLRSSKVPGAWALLLMRRTGLRIGELRGLEYHCVRADGRHPLLKVPLGKLNNERLVPLDDDSVKLIRHLQSIAPRSRPWLVPGARPGCPALKGWLEHILKEHSHDLPDPARITSHRLRHTYATEMLSAGMSLPSVMRLLGHRDFRMTLRYTAITLETVGDEYAKALARLATKYRLPVSSIPTRVPATNPDELLDHLAHWLRNHVPSSHPPVRALLKRIDRLKHDVRKLKSKKRRPHSAARLAG
jgi:site-specific recombinase XerD